MCQCSRNKHDKSDFVGMNEHGHFEVQILAMPMLVPLPPYAHPDGAHSPWQMASGSNDFRVFNYNRNQGK